MSREILSNYAKGMVILAGGVCFSLAVAELTRETFSWGLLLILGFSTFVAPRMSLALPRSRFFISFSDASVFLTFLLYGGPAAIVVAVLETIANCLYIRSKGYSFGRLMIPVNVSINSVSIAATYLFWTYLQSNFFTALDVGNTQHLLTTLGTLALTQFAVSSFLTATFLRLRDGGTNLWTIWRQDCFTSSMTQIVGAGLAGLVYKLINFGDIVTGVIAFLALSIAYLSYRQSISEVNDAMLQAESAERGKAEVERERRLEAEKHASQLAATLEKEEKAKDEAQAGL